MRHLQVQNQHPCTFFPDSACCRSRCVCVETPVLVLQCRRLLIPPSCTAVGAPCLAPRLSVCLACIHTIPAVSGLGVWVCWQGCRESRQCCENRQSVLPAELVLLSVHWAAGALATQPAAVCLVVVGLGEGGVLASLMLQLYGTMLAGCSCWLCSWASTALSISSPLLLVRRGLQLAHQSFGLTPILAAPSYCGGAAHVVISFHTSCWPRGCSGRFMALTFKGLTLGLDSGAWAGSSCFRRVALAAHSCCLTP